MKKINTVKDIDTSTSEGRLLLMSLSKLTCTVHPDKTPDEVINMLNLMADDITSW